MIGTVETTEGIAKPIDDNEGNLKAEKKFLSNLDKHINKSLDEETINPTEKTGTVVYPTLKEYIYNKSFVTCLLC